MAENTLGKLFKITSFGESHGPAVGVVIDGLPSGIAIDNEGIRQQLRRRRPGQSIYTTQRNETDEFEILSGIHDGVTLGSPVCIIIRNEDQRPDDYDELAQIYRPGHADYTYTVKYGNRDHRGGGRSSARITAGWVAAGAIAEQILKTRLAIDIVAWVDSVHEQKCPEISSISRNIVDSSVVRCPDTKTSAQIEKIIDTAKNDGNSLGGVIKCSVRNCPAGLGEPVFGKLNARLANALMNLNAVKGIEFGEGFESTKMTGSEMNDSFIKDESGKISTRSNHSGGIQGGISNGQEIFFRLAFKPTSTIAKEQETVNSKGETIIINTTGRHDPCVLPRAVPIVESLTAITLLDLWLEQKIAGLI